MFPSLFLLTVIKAREFYKYLGLKTSVGSADTIDDLSRYLKSKICTLKRNIKRVKETKIQISVLTQSDASRKVALDHQYSSLKMVSHPLVVAAAFDWSPL